MDGESRTKGDKDRKIGKDDGDGTKGDEDRKENKDEIRVRKLWMARLVQRVTKTGVEVTMTEREKRMKEK
jgi:hypothetical protein